MKAKAKIFLWPSLSGLLFGIGLLSSGLAQPEVILAAFDFRDFSPRAYVAMASAVVTMAALRRLRLVAAAPKGRIDRRLLTGAALFGVGWGLAGTCPGPAFLLTGAGNPKALLFLSSMLAGMALADRLSRRSASGGQSSCTAR